MKYKLQRWMTDLDTFGTSYDVGIADTDTVYMNNSYNKVGLSYYNLLDNSAGCAYINVPLPYAQCEQIKGTRIAELSGYTGSVKLRVNIDAKNEAYRIFVVLTGVNDASGITTIAGRGDIDFDACETYELTVDLPTSNLDPGIVIGYTDTAFRLNMQAGSTVYLTATEFVGSSYTTTLNGYAKVDYTFATDNEGIIIQQLSSTITELENRIATLESINAHLIGQFENNYVSR